MIRVRLFVPTILVLSSGIGGCAASTSEFEGEPRADLAQAEEGLAGGSAYFKLDAVKGSSGSAATNATTYVISKVNGGRFQCGTSSASSCTVDLKLPADCDWECQDGVLGTQSVKVYRGAVAYKRGAKRPTLTVAAAFDTWRPGLGSRVAYRLSNHYVYCKMAPCAPLVQASKLNATTSFTVSSVDFSQADDVNYNLDPKRGIDALGLDEGLVVTGKTSGTKFIVDRVFREWTPKVSCFPQATARDYYFHSQPDATHVEFTTESEAEHYSSPSGDSIEWLVRNQDASDRVDFVGGFNDLWAVRFSVDRTTCAVTLTGEH